MKIKDFEHFREIINALNESGLANKYPDVQACCHIAWDCQDINLLQELLDEYPGIYDEALRNIKEINYWQEKEPFRPYMTEEEEGKVSGKFHIGNTNGFHVCLDPLDFTRGLFICGEIGGGKSYPILRICDHILSIPKELRGFNLVIIQAIKRDADFLVRDHPDLRIIEMENLRRAPFQVEGWDEVKKKRNSFCGIFSSNNWLMAHGQPLFKRNDLRL